MRDSKKRRSGRARARKQQPLRRIGVALILLLSLVAVGVALDGTTTSEWTAPEGAVIDPDDAPRVELGTDVESDRRHPKPGDGSVNLWPEVRIEGASDDEVRYNGYDGTYVNVSDLELSDAVEIESGHADNVTIEGSAETVEYRTPELENASSPDIRYRGGDLTMTLPIDEAVAVVNSDSGSDIDIVHPNNGEVTIDLPESAGWNEIALETSDGAPVIDSGSASPTGQQSDDLDTLSVNVSDPDDRELEADFELNGESVGSDTVVGNGTVEVPTDGVVGGQNHWNVTVTDVFGQDTSDSYSFESPAELEIYDEENPDSLIDDREVEVTVWSGRDTWSLNTTDGTVDLSGLPVGDEFTVQAEADGYVSRQTVIRSIFDQGEMFLLPDDAETVTVRFTLDDPTGQFDHENSRVIVQKPIERNGSSDLYAVVSDEMGPGGFTTILERDQRYLLEVEDLRTGETRTLGPYVATASETVTLEIDQIGFEYEDAEIGYRWGAEWVDDPSPAIDLAFAADNSFEELSVTIRERGGSEAVIYEEDRSNIASLQDRAMIPSSVENPNTTTYSVEWKAVITDSEGEEEEISGSVVVGPDQLEVGVEGVPDLILHMVAVFAIMIIGALFSAANVEVGGVVTSLAAGLFWFVGFLPGAVSGMMIGLALLVSVLYMVRRSPGPR